MMFIVVFLQCHTPLYRLRMVKSPWVNGWKNVCLRTKVLHGQFFVKIFEVLCGTCGGLNCETKKSEQRVFAQKFSVSVLRWMDCLRFYVLFNSTSVISGRCLDDNERLLAMEFRLRLRRSKAGSNSVR